MISQKNIFLSLKFLSYSLCLKQKLHLRKSKVTGAGSRGSNISSRTCRSTSTYNPSTTSTASFWKKQQPGSFTALGNKKRK